MMRALARHRLGVLDRAFFLLESDEATCHVGLLAIFTPPVGAGPDFVRNLVAGMREQTAVAAPFNYQLAHHRPPVQIGPWLELRSEDVDLDYHFRHSALPRPGTQRDLGVLISRLHSRPLDPSRPMWEQHIIEGLEGNRFALYFKVHHALMDGVAGTGKFAQSLTEDPSESFVRPIWTVGQISTRRSDGRASGERGSRLRRTLLALRGVMGLVMLGANASRHREVRDRDRAVPFLGPVSPTLNGRVSRQRRVVTQSYELSRIRAVSKASSVSPNDVFLAICSAALRRYLMEIGEPQVRSLTAGVPVSLRQSQSSGTGNAVGMLSTKLHTDIADPLARLQAISRSATAAKAGLSRLPDSLKTHQTVLATSPLMLQSMIGLAGRGGRPHANVVLSNVPGPAAPQFLGGARLEEAYPISMLMHGQTLNITAFSTGGRLNIGLVGCRDQLPHLQRTATYLADALSELESAVLADA